MKPKIAISLFLSLLLSLTLVACSKAPASPQAGAGDQSTQSANLENPSPTATELPDPAANNLVSLSNFWVEEVPKIDQQGAVAVEITPININNPGSTLDFQVSLNTHSVDLSMNLASLATLTTDPGHSVQALLWEAPRGGHHVQGKLSFPADADGAPLLEGAHKLTITLKNLDVPERIFVWEK